MLEAIVMDFELAGLPTREVLTARDFSRNELTPNYRKRAKHNRLDNEMWTALAATGLVGMRTPERYGGSGVSNVTAGLVLKELAYGDFTLAYALTTQTLITELIAESAPVPIKEHWLPRQASGHCLLTFCLTEPHAGSDLKTINTATIKEPGHLRVTGKKTSVSVASQAEAFIVFSRNNTGGYATVLVEASEPGVTVGSFDDMGCRPSNRGWVNFQNVIVPAGNLITEGSPRVSLLPISYGRIQCCMVAIGAALASVDEATAYATQRFAFGQPIARFEDVAFKLVRARTMLDAAENQCLKALWLKDVGGDYVTHAAMVKSWIPRLCADIIHDLILIFGHYGYSDEVNLQQRLRDVIAFEIADGTAAIQNLHLVKQWLGRDYLPYEPQ
jgi:cyclohexanecarboxyl-CoA dehydrogenase